MTIGTAANTLSLSTAAVVHVVHPLKPQNYSVILMMFWNPVFCYLS